MKVGIIGAMEPEVAVLREQIENLTTEKYAGIEFYTGTIAGIEVVVSLSGIGKVAASVSATLLIEKYAPDCVINTGSAGGFDPKLNVGDVVIGSEVRHHDADLTVFGYEIGQLPKMPAAFTPHPELARAAREATAISQNDVQIVEGLIATGDTFMADPVRVEQVRANFPTMQACEMEAAAIAQTCHLFEVPFVVVRSLSDIAGKQSEVSFDEYLVTAGKHSADMVVAMLPLCQKANLN
ncbi:5'-methylthioadenosine/S-adenosylhomocysteine nucleosidase [Psychrobium sp. 1_MG-2023]|uniref:5'-methylthioadenosine/S-adenosylhomocysteine nucleosidase n=1 Tax=Psychrobium sp. 1_MG-2023 TaxID=3062624 RepID=UPI000C31FCDD|nr:5'-methylthioadenosine/S-adenosylhomocysteine nucleosidase [Psychrobium sp. 1_MG-2023]MDP2560965.1 5'-methylthioadenosine/S-adenosylhomocysteine nucleosidase [Psychrobium sp. 1_MG-2023]PKF54942.1 5'-methylthioadenosine/S-adenosylhomocysteine nucleosidase [Alteromonadales bacterium alter-6D02]